MTQPQPLRKSQPVITLIPDGNGWSYTILLNGTPILGGWCRGKRAVAQRDADYQLSRWLAEHGPEAAA